ncbi:hypothetical protein BCF46_3730 [Litoreibacter meonggei]|uniref:Uncharacterized protein n=2 Tax=Rhodobacterales TaxID=204455 RepID=A0A497VJ47_9RHOB|nr:MULTISPECIES: hypothetical protein [Rhodobacterales]MDU9006731.1 hypothetical protein [Sedimentitalea todarodis]RLJ40658.1 hypothetical protein BCF46_3730 [Litoreibacter meonggei]
MPDMFSMRSDDDTVDVGIVYSPSPETLRVFGASYMQDKETSGSLKILDPKGATFATFDVWQSKWVLTAEMEA